VKTNAAGFSSDLLMDYIEESRGCWPNFSLISTPEGGGRPQVSRFSKRGVPLSVLSMIDNPWRVGHINGEE
jgi:hypothetical protein